MKTIIKQFLLKHLDTYFISEVSGIDIHPINSADKFILKETLAEYHIKSNIIADDPNGRSVIIDGNNEIQLIGKAIIPNQYRLKEKFKLNLRQYPELSPIPLPKDFVVNKVEDKKNNRIGYVLSLIDLGIIEKVFVPNWVFDNSNLCVPDERYVIN